MRRRILSVLVFVIGSGLLGDVLADDRAELARLRQEITALVGAARCANLVNCRIAALGANACGTAEYIAYSWRSTDMDALQTKIAEYNLVYEDVQQQQPSDASGCVDREPPAAACVSGRCVLPTH
ncbi:MAG: hypothetical protein ABI619_08590 [Betaproteobacteria bacterium]